jgi:hypothetical protein
MAWSWPKVVSPKLKPPNGGPSEEMRSNSNLKRIYLRYPPAAEADRLLDY